MNIKVLKVCEWWLQSNLVFNLSNLQCIMVFFSCFSWSNYFSSHVNWSSFRLYYVWEMISTHVCRRLASTHDHTYIFSAKTGKLQREKSSERRSLFTKVFLQSSVLSGRWPYGCVKSDLKTNALIRLHLIPLPWAVILN